MRIPLVTTLFFVLMAVLTVVPLLRQCVLRPRGEQDINGYIVTPTSIFVVGITDGLFEERVSWIKIADESRHETYATKDNVIASDQLIRSQFPDVVALVTATSSEPPLQRAFVHVEVGWPARFGEARLIQVRDTDDSRSLEVEHGLLIHDLDEAAWPHHGVIPLSMRPIGLLVLALIAGCCALVLGTADVLIRRKPRARNPQQETSNEHQ